MRFEQLRAGLLPRRAARVPLFANVAGWTLAYGRSRATGGSFGFASGAAALSERQLDWLVSAGHSDASLDAGWIDTSGRVANS